MAPLSAPGAAEPASVAILPWGDVIEDFLDPLGQDVRSYLAEASGGWLFGYAAALQQACWRPVIAWASRKVTTPERIMHQATGTPVWLVPGSSRPITRWNARTSLRRWLAAPIAAFEAVLRREGCSAIITQEYEDPRFDRVIGLARHLRIPAYASFQGGEWTGSWLESLVRRRSIAQGAGLIIASAAERARVTAHYGPSLPPIAAIANPIDLAQWRPMAREEARRRLEIPAEEFVVINHGRIDIRRKGLDVLVDAWARLAPARDMRLVIIGSGQDHQRFADLLEQRHPPGLVWHPAYDTDREKMRTWLSAADLYVSASRLEGMPVAPLEAMACGLPVLGTDAKGLADIIDGGEAHGGIRIPRDDPAALAGAIVRLRDDPTLRTRLGLAARRRVEDNYSLEVVGDALGRLLSASRKPVTDFARQHR